MDPGYFASFNTALSEVLEMIAGGWFSRGNREIFRPLVDMLRFHDEYLLLADPPSDVEAEETPAQAFQKAQEWTRKSILNVARSGHFALDRAIRDYPRDVWMVSPAPDPESLR